MSQELDLWPPPPPPPRLRARHANVLPGAAAPDALEDEAPDSDQEDEEADAPEEASPPDLDALLGDALDEAEVAEDLDYAAEDALPLGPRRRRRRAPDPPAPAAASSDGPAMQGPDSQDLAPVPPVLPDPRPGQDRGAAARHVRYKYIPSTTYEVGSGHIMVSFGRVLPKVIMMKKTGKIDYTFHKSFYLSNGTERTPPSMSTCYRSELFAKPWSLLQSLYIPTY